MARTNAKRALLALLTVSLVASGSGRSFAGPEDDVYKLLLSADNVRATGIGPKTIFISWVDRSIVETGYRIEMSLDEQGPYISAGFARCTAMTPPTIVGQLCATQIQVEPASDPTPRWLRVVPIIEIGNPNTPLFEGRPSDPDPALLGPVPPSDLKCNGGGEIACVAVTSITLTWTDNSDELYFWVMRARGLINPDFGTQPHAVLPAETTEFSEILRDFNTTFYYRIVAVRELNILRQNGEIVTEQSFSNSDPERTKVLTAPVPAPSDPGDTDADYSNGDVTLTWPDTQTDPSNPYIEEDGWFIEFGSASGRYEAQTTAPRHPGQGTVTYREKLPPDTFRCYRVRAWRAGPAYSQYSDETCVGSIPKPPSNLTARAVSNALVILTWLDNSLTEQEFLIDRCLGTCTASSTWAQIDTVPANTITYNDTSTVQKTTYSYRLRARNSTGTSAASNIATVTTPAAPLVAPTSLLATPLSSYEIELRWTDNTSNEAGFRIEYRAPAGEWDLLTDVGPVAGSGGQGVYVDDDTLNGNTRRCYRVRARTSSGAVSDPSNESCATTFPPSLPNGAPTGLVATPTSNTSVLLTWQDNATNEQGFRIDHITFADKPCPQTTTGIAFKTLTTRGKRTGTGSVSMQVTGLTPHSASYFRVVATNLEGPSDPSNTSGCAQTFGPRRPIWLDPSEHYDIEVTRCEATFRTPENGVKVGRVKVWVTAIVPGTDVADNDIFDSASNPAVLMRDTRPESTVTDDWVLKYKFRKGPNYRLIVQSYDVESPFWGSSLVEVRDIKVLADCPTEP